MNRLRLLLRVAAVLGVVAVAYLGITFVRVWRAAHRDDARPAQAILVLGAAQYGGRPSAVLRARLDHAAALFRRGLAPTIVVTGGKATGDQFTEATAAASYLHSLGVNDSVILRETGGRTSWTSLAATARFLRARGLDDVVLVSDPFHSARISGMADELGLRAVTSPTRTSPIRGTRVLRRIAVETVVVAVGEVVGFRRLDRVERRTKRLALLLSPSPSRPPRADTDGARSGVV